MKPHFNVDEQVVIRHTGSFWDGVRGVVVGTASTMPVVDLFIVLLNNKVTWTDAKAIVIPGSHIKKITK